MSPPVIDPARAVRIKTSTGWANLAIQGPPGVPGYPTPVVNGQWLKGSGGAVVWSAIAVADVSGAEATANKGANNGYASLDSGGKVPLSQLPPVGADLIYQGDFPAGTPYTDGEIVVSNGIAYLCVTPTSAAPTAWPGGPTPTPPAPAVSYGTTLPASPADAQEAILVDSITNPSYQWRFRYNAGSTSAYKWEYVGGIPWSNAGGSTNGVVSASGTLVLSGGPSFTIPRTGDYFVGWGAFACNNGTFGGAYTAFVYVNYSVQGNGGQVAIQPGVAWDGASVYAQVRNAAISSGQQVRISISSNHATSQTNFSSGFLVVEPARVS